MMQFPISFKNTDANRDYLDRVIEKFKQYRLVCEVHHNSWTHEGTLRYFAEKGIAFCNVDQPKSKNRHRRRKSREDIRCHRQSL